MQHSMLHECPEMLFSLSYYGWIDTKCQRFLFPLTTHRYFPPFGIIAESCMSVTFIIIFSTLAVM